MKYAKNEISKEEWKKQRRMKEAKKNKISKEEWNKQRMK